MSLLTFKCLAALIIFLITLLGGLAPIWARVKGLRQKSFWYSEAFASGVFLGAAVFHLLPDAANDFFAILGTHYPYAHLICIFTFLILLLAERVVLKLAKLRDYYNPNLIPYLLTIILCVHAFFDGSVVGINSTFAAALIIFTAVIAHKASESFSLATRLNCSEISTTRVFAIFCVFSLITPMGIAFGTVAQNILESDVGAISAATFNAIAAGTFLYAALFHHHDEHHTTNEVKAKPLYEIGTFLLGLAIMGLVSGWT